MEDKKNDSGQSRLESFFGGKGFYIVLFLCVAVIGVSAWTLLSSGKSAVENVSLGDVEFVAARGRGHTGANRGGGDGLGGA